MIYSGSDSGSGKKFRIRQKVPDPTGSGSTTLATGVNNAGVNHICGKFATGTASTTTATNFANGTAG
jgi:hypothetical protein